MFKHHTDLDDRMSVARAIPPLGAGDSNAVKRYMSPKGPCLELTKVTGLTTGSGTSEDSWRPSQGTIYHVLDAVCVREETIAKRRQLCSAILVRGRLSHTTHRCSSPLRCSAFAIASRPLCTLICSYPLTIFNGACLLGGFWTPIGITWPTACPMDRSRAPDLGTAPALQRADRRSGRTWARSCDGLAVGIQEGKPCFTTWPLYP